jgi:hypothetical protein
MNAPHLRPDHTRTDHIRTELPGPNARALIARDAR